MNMYQMYLKAVGNRTQVVSFAACKQIRELWMLGSLKLIKTEVHDKLLEDTFYPFSNPNSTSTYSDCVTVSVEDEVVCLKILEGRFLDGSPTDERVSYFFTGEWWEIESLTNALERDFYDLTYRLLCEQEAKEREQRRLAIADKILKSIV